ncbi:MAG: 2-phospho-L-lactate transferase [Anaerolineales bacterium]|nr:2-phospho-L-lactate transferase [Anaerolineae bacterium]PWB52372.1 MAG: 2-phospho-L-lactate transferase [Anaerolineales bacterium]
MINNELTIVALAGGVGGAKLADGLAQVLQPDNLTIIVNTADDFTHIGLRISPDLDTVCYTLADMANPATGWGRKDETWNAFRALSAIGMPDWFRLGDTDLATHLVRDMHLTDGWSLSQVTEEFCRMWKIKVKVLPMTDDIVRTWVYTDEGDLEFQEYFVRRKCEPVVGGFKFVGVEKAHPAPGVLEAIQACEAVVICPSNPWVSINPILSIPGIRGALSKKTVVAVSPIIGDQTVRGPAAKMFSELGIKPSALAVALHYQEIIDAIFLDQVDHQQAKDIEALGISSVLTDALMIDKADRGRLASEVIEYIRVKLKGTET